MAVGGILGMVCDVSEKAVAGAAQDGGEQADRVVKKSQVL